MLFLSFHTHRLRHHQRRVKEPELCAALTEIKTIVETVQMRTCEQSSQLMLVAPMFRIQQIAYFCVVDERNRSEINNNDWEEVLMLCWQIHIAYGPREWSRFAQCYDPRRNKQHEQMFNPNLMTFSCPFYRQQLYALTATE